MILSYAQFRRHLGTNALVTQDGPGTGYLFIGDEPILMNQAVQGLVTHFTTQAKKQGHAAEIKRIWIETAEDWQRLSATTQQFSLFKASVLLNASYLKKTWEAAAKAWLTLVAETPIDADCLILQAPFLKSTSFSVLKHHPHLHLVEIKSLKGKDFVAFIESELTTRGIVCTKDIPHLIADYTEGNLLAAHHCIQQLDFIFYNQTGAPQQLDGHSIRDVLTDSAAFPLYALTEACLAGNRVRMIRVLQRLKDAQTEPLLVIWCYSKLLRQLIELSTLKNSAHRNEPQSLGIWPTQQPLYQTAIKRLSVTTLQALLMACHQVDWAIKSTTDRPVWDSLEQIALSFGLPP